MIRWQKAKTSWSNASSSKQCSHGAINLYQYQYQLWQENDTSYINLPSGRFLSCKHVICIGIWMTCKWFWWVDSNDGAQTGRKTNSSLSTLKSNVSKKVVIWVQFREVEASIKPTNLFQIWHRLWKGGGLMTASVIHILFLSCRCTSFEKSNHQGWPLPGLGLVSSPTPPRVGQNIIIITTHGAPLAWPGHK